jgi:trans-aconitate methyltransferase
MRSATEVFGDWAKDGRDERMAKGHADAVANMLDFAILNVSDSFTAIDAGCGNGWAARSVQALPACAHAQGVDGAKEMIERARTIDPDGTYIHADLMEWKPAEPVDLVHSMEVFYYFRQPGALLTHIVKHWLKPGGRLIAGVDHYLENPPSHDWAAQNGIAFMTTLSEAQWLDLCRNAGLGQVQSWRANAREDWAGTLIFTGTKR